MVRLWRRRAGWSVAVALSAVALATGCNSDPPTVFVGESAHFRLYIDPDLLARPYDDSADDALAALETEWSDVATMLHMPDGKITYRWYTDAHATAACGPGELGCMKASEMEIDAPTLPNEHELNHAYAYLRTHRRAIPLLAEGLAEAIGCDGEQQAAGSSDWRALAASLPSGDVESQGGRFVRTLIRSYGIDAFLQYYQQSPERRDPALFGANFAHFWGTSVDDVWAQANGAAPFYRPNDTKICPCSLPTLVPGEASVIDRARAPYWTLPTDGQTFALTAASPLGAAIFDCSGSQLSLPNSDASLARLDPGTAWFARTPVVASIGHFVSDDCASAAHYPLAKDASGPTYLTVAIPASAAGSDVFVALDVAAPAQVDHDVQAICDSCAFDQGSCQPVTGTGATPVSGSVYMRLGPGSFHSASGADVAWALMRFSW
jgi:hypothetical protein